MGMPGPSGIRLRPIKQGSLANGELSQQQIGQLRENKVLHHFSGLILA